MEGRVPVALSDTWSAGSAGSTGSGAGFQEVYFGATLIGIGQFHLLVAPRGRLVEVHGSESQAADETFERHVTTTNAHLQLTIHDVHEQLLLTELVTEGF